jgi:hypothetical protein
MSTSTGVNFFKDFKSVLNLALTFERSGAVREPRPMLLRRLGMTGSGLTLLRRLGMTGSGLTLLRRLGMTRFGFDVVAAVGT